VESLTAYPSILGARVNTLHPAVFGGILARRGNPEDERHIAEYTIPLIDLVIVDLYPFEDTVRKSNDDEEIIEKIDIGGIFSDKGGSKELQ
jgi:phosphoribosylaminoimidazolecarboxamide formyltransferase/IMP cyclohydrolase